MIFFPQLKILTVPFDYNLLYMTHTHFEKSIFSRNERPLHEMYPYRENYVGVSNIFICISYYIFNHVYKVFDLLN